MKSSLVFSILLHLVAAALVLLGLARPKPAPSRPSTVVITLRESGGGGGGARGTSAPRRRARKIPLSRLGLARPEGTGGSRTRLGSGNGGGAKPGPGDGYDLANSIGIERDTDLYPFFRALHRKLDAATGFPAELTKRRAKGRVTAHVQVDRRGVFTGHILRVDSDQPLLKTYALASLVFALREPVSERLWLEAETTVVALFEFDLFSDGALPKTAEVEQFKNQLHIVRSAYVPPRANEQIEYAYTHYFPPILFMPGFGGYIDFISAYKLVKELTEDNVDPRQIEADRLKMMKDRWNEVLRKRSP